MKVVLFCGGYGLRMRDGGMDSAPKPMMTVGHRPVLWHIMRYYAHYGFNEFVLCLGYGATSVKDYFLHYDETRSNDFVLTKGGEHVELLGSDIADWQITFVDTGMETSIGERLRRVRHHLEPEGVFLANYGDVLTDAPMDRMVDEFLAGDSIASLLAVPPQTSFHVVDVDEQCRVTGLVGGSELPMWVNGGYFVLRPEIFDHLEEGEDLVGDAFVRLAAAGRLGATRYRGFWAAMDTLKERSYLEDLFRQGNPPWQVWQRPARQTAV